MIKKKVCMLGTLSVGKTSLVRRFVHSLFSDAYKTTIGVKIDKKQMVVDGEDVIMMLWDMEGVDKYQALRQSHLRGADACFLVVDTTRPNSLEQALAIREQVRELLPDVPAQLVFNKSDLVDAFALDWEIVRALDEQDYPPLRTSARSGANVELMFETLARRLIASNAQRRPA